jgi:Tol biopolymer transport system component
MRPVQGLIPHALRWTLAAALAGSLLATTPITAGATALGSTERLSVATTGAQGDFGSFASSISADGRFVAFESNSNLAPGANYSWKSYIFVRDRLAGTTELASVSGSGTVANDVSTHPSISADGRYVAFQSSAGNLAPGDFNGCADVFVHDRVSGTTERASVSSAGVEGGSESGYVVSISGDGRYVAFTSMAADLVPGDTNDTSDVFVRDRLSGTTQRVSVSTAGAQGDDSAGYAAAMSADGRSVAFQSYATNLVPGDTYNTSDVFCRDLLTGVTDRVNVSNAGVPGRDTSGMGIAISGDGRYVAFETFGDDIVSGDTNSSTDILVRDRALGITELASVSSAGLQDWGESVAPSISADGRYVAFTSMAAGLVAGDANGWGVDVFVRDRALRTTEMVSLSNAGAQGAPPSTLPCISGDGRFVSFSSADANLVDGDTNVQPDVFLRTRVLSPFVDGTPPTTALPPTGSLYAAPTTHLSAVDAPGGSGVARTFFRVDGGNRCDGSTIVLDTEGEHVLEFWSVDWFGNIELPHKTATVRVDPTAPVTTDNAPADWVNHDVTVTLSPSDALSGVGATRHTLNGGPSALGLVVPVSTEGENAVRYWSTDNVGNVETARNATVRIDKTCPSTGLTPPDPGAAPVALLTPTDGVGGSGLANTYYRVDGGAQAEGTSVAFTTAGSHTVEYWSVDVAGNVEPHKSATVTVAPAASSATIKTTSSSALIGKTPVLSGAIAPVGLVGKVMVVYVTKPGSPRWTYSSNRVVYALSGAAAWQYKYYFKPGMARGTYKFKALVPPYPGFAACQSGTITIKVR